MPNPVGTSITIEEIPDRFKTLKILGKGNTSIVLEKDESSVVVLTRDNDKNTWLTKAAFTNYLGSYSSIGSGVNNFAFRQNPIKGWAMPKLYTLSGKNKTKVRRIIKKFNELNDRYVLNRTQQNTIIGEWIAEEQLSFSRALEQSEFKSLVVDYNVKQLNFDLKQNRFMQDSAGHLVVADTIAIKEILTLINKSRRTKKSVSRLSYDRGLVASAAERIHRFLGAK